MKSVIFIRFNMFYIPDFVKFNLFINGWRSNGLSFHYYTVVQSYNGKKSRCSGLLWFRNSNWTGFDPIVFRPEFQASVPLTLKNTYSCSINMYECLSIMLQFNNSQWSQGVRKSYWNAIKNETEKFDHLVSSLTSKYGSMISISVELAGTTGTKPNRTHSITGLKSRVLKLTNLT